MIFFCCVMFSSLISQIARFPQTILASTCTFLRVAIATARDENNNLRFLSPDLIRTQNNLFASAWNGQQKNNGVTVSFWLIRLTDINVLLCVVPS